MLRGLIFELNADEELDDGCLLVIRLRLDEDSLFEEDVLAGLRVELFLFDKADLVEGVGLWVIPDFIPDRTDLPVLLPPLVIPDLIERPARLEPECIPDLTDGKLEPFVLDIPDRLVVIE